MFKITARTVLELGAELISSDIIAFYELIKNAFDANSKTGAEIHFRIVLRRNTYLRLREKAGSFKITSSSNSELIFVQELHNELARSLDPSAGGDLINEFQSETAAAQTCSEFITHLDGAYQSLNSIVIRDTGSGMSFDDLVSNYLTIGTPSRKRDIDHAVANKAPKTPFLGEKGIGRLSAMRLGSFLSVSTARASDTHMNELEVNWNDFDNLDAMIDDIEVEPYVGEQKLTQEWSGTLLTIKDLAEDWTEQRVKRLAKDEFCRLTDPFTHSKRRPRIALFWNESRIDIPRLDQRLLDSAHAKFQGSYALTTSGPEMRVRLEVRNLGYNHPIEQEEVVLKLPELESAHIGVSQQAPLSTLESVGPFEFEGYWYNRRLLKGLGSLNDETTFHSYQHQWSGIMVFRDGFRVLPYGNEDDDWLSLDRVALGRKGYGLNKAQFVGRVQISRVRNPGLVDQTNREGLRHTPEQKVFLGILEDVIKEHLWTLFKATDRKYKRNPIVLGDIKTELTTLETRAKTAVTKVRQLIPKEDSDVAEDLNSVFLLFKELASRAQETIAQVEEDSRQMLHMAGVGLMVEIVAHELTRAAESALGSLETLPGKELPIETRAKLETLKAEMKTVSKRLRVLDQMSVSGRQRSETFDLNNLLNDLIDGHASQFHRHRIRTHVEKPPGALRVKLVKGMVVQVLENLITNSVYWLQFRADRESAYIPTIHIGVTLDPLTITYSDNGPGIAPDHQEKVFQPFWSLKEKNRRRGLGLFVARENARYMDGELYLLENQNDTTGRLNTFVFELPEGSIIK